MFWQECGMGRVLPSAKVTQKVKASRSSFKSGCLQSPHCDLWYHYSRKISLIEKRHWGCCQALAKGWQNRAAAGVISQSETLGVDLWIEIVRKGRGGPCKAGKVMKMVMRVCGGRLPLTQAWLLRQTLGSSCSRPGRIARPLLPSPSASPAPASPLRPQPPPAGPQAQLQGQEMQGGSTRLSNTFQGICRVRGKLLFGNKRKQQQPRRQQKQAHTFHLNFLMPRI